MNNLKWLSAACGWLVTVTSGVVVASASFYTEIIGEDPKSEWIMIVAWCALIITIVSGVLCYFSTFKQLVNKEHETDKWSSWIRITYSIMLFSFLGGMLFFGLFIVYNKL